MDAEHPIGAGGCESIRDAIWIDRRAHLHLDVHDLEAMRVRQLRKPGSEETGLRDDDLLARLEEIGRGGIEARGSRPGNQVRDIPRP
jgi:hypothetical protein